MKFDAMEVVETSCCTVRNVCYTCQCFARVDGPVEMLLKVEQGRAGQGRAGQGRAGHNRTSQGRTEHTGRLHTSDSNSVTYHLVMPSIHMNLQQAAVTAQLHSKACSNDSLVVLVELVPATASP